MLLEYRRPDGKKRFEVFVCTAAERGYAMEAWRVLDTEGKLIPPHLRSQRIVCIASGKRKMLGPTLGLGSLRGSQTRTAMPLAVIIDDRCDVCKIAFTYTPCMLLSTLCTVIAVMPDIS